MKLKLRVGRAALVIGLFLGCQFSTAFAMEVTVAWEAPTNNVDGSPAMDLAGYKLHCGTASRSYTMVQDVGNVNAFKVTNLPDEATYFFSVTAYSSNMVQSDYSEEVVWSAPDITPPTISIAATMSVTADDSGFVAVPDLVQSATVTDNSSPRTGIVVTQEPSAGTVVGVGITSILLTATDQAGNISEATVLLNVAMPAAPDTIPPTISVASSASLTAGANGMISLPDFRQSAVVSDDCTPPASIALTQSPAAGTLVGTGTTIVGLTATDQSGNSAQATIAVNVTALPTVALSSPGNGYECRAPATLTLTATAVANGHLLTKVQFLSGATLLGEATGPFTCTWANVPAGTYTLVARLVYDNGALDSAPVTVVLNNLPAPWNTQDIGAGAARGAASASNGVYAVSGAGNISGSSDKFRFVYQNLTGDGEIKARISSLQRTGKGAKSGIMIRESLTGASRQAALTLTSAGKLEFVRRSSTGGSVQTTSSKIYKAPNNWVRLVRSGQTITAYKSSNGTNWTSIGSQSIAMASAIQIGLVTASGSTSTLCTSSIANVTVLP